MVSGSLQAALLLYVQMLLLKSQHIHCQQSLTTSAGIYSGQPDSCGYGMISPSLFPNGHLATFSSSSPPLEGLPQNGCGACLQLTCNDPSPGVCAPGTAPITVQIIDTSSSNLQLDSADITAVSSHGNRLGHIRVSVEQVNCAATGPITVRIEQLSPMANGYIKLALLNVAGSNGISSVAIAPAGTQSFGLLKNTYGAVWEGSVPTAPPLDLQISSSGQQLVLSNLVTAATAPGDVQSTVQFSPAASLGSGGAASPAAAAAGRVMQHEAQGPFVKSMLRHDAPNSVDVHVMSSYSRRSLLTNPSFQALQDYVNQLPVSGSSTASPAAAASPAIVPANTSSASPSPEALPSPAPAPQALPSPRAASPSPAPAAEPLPATTPNGTLFNLVAAAAQQSCPTIFQTLSLSPDLTTWVNLIQGKGLQYNLNGTNQGITMFAPVNDAFSEPLLAGISGLDNAQTVLDLTGQIPDIISDLLGYSVVPQQLQENQLLAGDTFNTTNVIKTGSGVNGVPAYIPVGIKTTTDMTQVVGVGSIATIVQPNIQACGSIIHLVSNALLPFNFSCQPGVQQLGLPQRHQRHSANSEPHPEPSLLHDLTQGLRVSYEMLDYKTKAVALQNSHHLAKRRQDAGYIQELRDAHAELTATVTKQAANIAEHAASMDCQSATHNSLAQGRRRVQAAELDHIVSDSHLEVLEEEKQGLQKTLEETEDELAKERQRNEYARGEAQHRATKRQELQEARDQEERLKIQMHARWVQALKEVEMLKAVMIYGHFLFETLMKGPLQADLNTNAQEQTPALEEEDLYVYFSTIHIYAMAVPRV
ncbi:hypothetical protein WJX79_007026 [Trebouxia sp. C0005]